MRKLVLSAVLLTLAFGQAFGQKYLTREGYIRFFSSTPMEDIEATTNQASSVLDAATGEIVFQVLMNSFTFEKALMQEHFNENYVESEKFPKAMFKGKVNGLESIDLAKDGTHEVEISGEFTVHGVAKERTVKATLSVADGEILIESKFDVVPEDHDIEIPSVVRGNIAKNIEVTVKAKYQLHS